MPSDTQWLHSGGDNNKKPENDLGGGISKFEIATQPLNNLFDDILPEEGMSGLVDYRCFYIKNPWSNLHLRNLVVSISEGSGGSSIEFGLNQANEKQRLIMLGAVSPNTVPDSNGYIIINTEFGQPFQVDYGDDPTFATMASNLETGLRELPFCSTCTASAVVPTTGAPYIDIEFLGEAGRRKTELIRVLANRLFSTEGGHFVLQPADDSDPWNRTTDTQIATINLPSVTPIDLDSFDSTGIIHVWNPGTGLYQHLSYINVFTSVDLRHTIFSITDPLDFDAALTGSADPTNPPIWDVYGEAFVEPRDDKRFLIKVVRITEGSPINTVAPTIDTDTTEPPNISFGTSSISSLGNLFVFESFPIWIKRTTLSAIGAIENDNFNLSITGTLFSP